MRLDDDRWCFACGEKNPAGLKLDLKWDGAALSCRFTPKKEHQGYKDVAHGGLVSTVLDECMTNAAIHLTGQMYATAELTVRFKAPLGTGEETLTTARVEAKGSRLALGRAEMRRLSDNALIATGKSKLMRQA